MSDPPTGHRGDRGEPCWAALESAVRQGHSVTLSPIQCRDILSWVNEVTEDKNVAVRDNHRPPEAAP